MNEETMTKSPPASKYENYGRQLWQRILLTRESAIIILLVVVVVISSITVQNFGNLITMTYLLLDVAPILLIALPMTVVIITGEIDLSVASVFGLSSVVLGTLHRAGVPIVLAGIAVLVIGAIAGAINGFLITVVGLPSLAVTIGTLALYRGLAVGMLGTSAVTDFPPFWTNLAQENIVGTGIPVIMVPFLILAFVFVLILNFTAFGRGVYAIGLSTEAAIYSGVDVKRTKIILFILTGVVSSFAGIDYTLRFSNAVGSNGVGLELQVVAAAVLGGVSIFGGKGAIHGAIAGTLLIGVLASALRLANVASNAIDIITGAALVLSVVSTGVLAWLSRKRQRIGRTKRGVLN